jgi:hypothetical protein
VEFEALSQVERTNGPRLIHEEHKAHKGHKGHKETRTLSGGLHPVGGAALRQPEAGVATNRENR